MLPLVDDVDGRFTRISEATSDPIRHSLVVGY